MTEAQGAGPLELPGEWVNADPRPTWNDLGDALVALVSWRLDDRSSHERLHRLDRAIRQLDREAHVLGLHPREARSKRVRARLLARATWAPSGRRTAGLDRSDLDQPGAVALVRGGEQVARFEPDASIEQIRRAVDEQAPAGPRSWQPRGAAPGAWPLAYPSDVAVSGARIALADTAHNRVVLAGPDGEITHIVGDGSPGQGDGALEEARFEAPEGLVWFEDELVVADTANDRLCVVGLGDRTVDTRAKLSEGALPTGLTARRDGSLVATLAGEGRVVGVREGRTRPLHREGILTTPIDVVSGGSTLFVADLHGPKVVRLDEDGAVEETWEDPPLAEPRGLLWSQDRALVADPSAGAVFELAPEGAIEPLWEAQAPEAPSALANEAGHQLVLDGDHQIWRVHDGDASRIRVTEAPLTVAEHIRLDPIELAPGGQLHLSLSYLAPELGSLAQAEPETRGPLGDVRLVEQPRAVDGRLRCELSGRARASGTLRVRWSPDPQSDRETAWDLPVVVRPGADETLRLALSTRPV